jgi:hypothetical protein
MIYLYRSAPIIPESNSDVKFISNKNPSILEYYYIRI